MDYLSECNPKNNFYSNQFYYGVLNKFSFDDFKRSLTSSILCDIKWFLVFDNFEAFLSVLKYDIMMHHALVTIKCKQILRAMGGNTTNSCKLSSSQ
jgi:hypothetical protein